jgi:hypothetical protein
MRARSSCNSTNFKLAATLPTLLITVSFKYQDPIVRLLEWTLITPKDFSEKLGNSWT